MSWLLLGIICGFRHSRNLSGDFLVSFGVHAWLFAWLCSLFFKLMISRMYSEINQFLFALGVLFTTLCIKNSLSLGSDDFLATLGIEFGFFSLCKHLARVCCLADLLVCLPFKC